MPPKRKLEVELYKSIEARIQEAIDVLEERGGKAKPRCCCAGVRTSTTKTTSEMERSTIEE
jgi:hypothetical protein